MRVMVHLDERGAAFMALGLAEAFRDSGGAGHVGTAVVNFAPLSSRPTTVECRSSCYGRSPS